MCVLSIKVPIRKKAVNYLIILVYIVFYIYKELNIVDKAYIYLSLNSVDTVVSSSSEEGCRYRKWNRPAEFKSHSRLFIFTLERYEPNYSSSWSDRILSP